MNCIEMLKAQKRLVKAFVSDLFWRNVYIRYDRYLHIIHANSKRKIWYITFLPDNQRLPNWDDKSFLIDILKFAPMYYIIYIDKAILSGTFIELETTQKLIWKKRSRPLKKNFFIHSGDIGDDVVLCNMQILLWQALSNSRNYLTIVVCTSVRYALDK